MSAPSSVFQNIQQLLNGYNPSSGQQTALLEALAMAADALDAAGTPRPPSSGSGQRSSRANLLDAAQLAYDAGEPGTYVGYHDGLVYTPAQALTTLNRYLVALGWKTTSTPASAVIKDPSPNPSGRAGVLFWPDISRWQSGIDLGAVKAAGYAALMTKIGQGASTNGNAALIDPTWATVRPAAQTLWGQFFGCYWYVGDLESPDSQAARCLAAIVDTSIPVMLDWEDGAGNWANLLSVLAAFQAAGLKVTMLYTFPQYAAGRGVTNMDAAGLAVISRRYYDDTAQAPASSYASTPADSWNSFNGGTVRGLQFTRKGRLGSFYTGDVDVNAFRGTMNGLLAMFQGSSAVVTPPSAPAGSKPALFAPATWKGSLDKGLSFAHKSTPWNRTPQSLQAARVIDLEAWRVPGGRKGYALAAYLPGGTTRNEVEPNVPMFGEGAQVWFGLSFMLARNFPISSSFWHVLAQWKNDGDGSPPISLLARRGGLWLSGGYGHPDTAKHREFNAKICDVVPTRWYDIALGVTFSRFASVGSVTAYADGVKTLDSYRPATGTLYPTTTANTASQQSYLKYGLYRDPACKTEATVWQMGWAIGPSMGSVVLPGSG